MFGAGGTVGSQDWVKAALLVRAAGGDHRAMRFVSFEGGGDALGALQGRHVDVFAGDAAEALQAMAGGTAVRLLAVLSEARLDGALTGVPTAREQGVDLVWPTVRGLYISADVPDAALRAWTTAFEEAMSRARLRCIARAAARSPPLLPSRSRGRARCLMCGNASRRIGGRRKHWGCGGGIP